MLVSQIIPGDLPVAWDVSAATLNIGEDLRIKLAQRINIQRTFDKEPLTKRICVGESFGVMALVKLPS